MTNINQAAFFQKHLNVCFSGHRPNKLPNQGDLSQPAMNAVYHDLLTMIDNAVTEGKKQLYPRYDVRLRYHCRRSSSRNKKEAPAYPADIGASVYRKFLYDKGMVRQLQRHTSQVYKESDCRVCLAKSYYPQVYYDRNKWMIEHSSLLICYQSSGRGGAAYTVNSAKKTECRLST